MDITTIVDAALGITFVVGAVGVALFFAVVVSGPSAPRAPRGPDGHEAPPRTYEGE